MTEAIKLSNVSKKFCIGFEKDQGALGKLVSFMSGREAKKELQVLENINLTVAIGEVVGLIGRNGSGKSTLLRIIAGIYRPDSGDVFTRGRVEYLSGLHTGLSPKLTMKDNIFLMGSLMGLEKKEVAEKFDEIVDFAGLSQFVSTKVYQFSSGMVTRLGFSTTVHCLNHRQPDVLLLDEVFGSSGDIDFEDKASKKISELINGGSTVIMASHNLSNLEKYCHRALHLANGEITNQGAPKEVIEKYKVL